MKNFLFAALLIPSQAFAWGAVGHRTVAYVAQAQLSDAAQLGVKALLGDDSLADVANWADSLRSGDGYKQTIWYHFEKIPDGTSYLENLKQLPDWQKKKGGTVAAILLANKILRGNSSHAEQIDALKFLVHFVGDLHQPLHSGRPEDNGGVKLEITWHGEKMSLHHLWDTSLLSSGHPDFVKPGSDDQSARSYADFLLGKRTPTANAMDVEAWLNESLALRTAAYEKLYETDPDRYLTLHIQDVDLRLLQAGNRLAALLNDVFARAATPRVELDLETNIAALLEQPIEQALSFKK